ncbi:hypothetical protein BGZ54_005529 [Gamsiella multidivaricata]|nr:hypothetical protein BGZ54_005529 [Gamsiella multidivaricata]
MMGVMLEQAGISYQILERSEAIRSAGCAISIGPTVMRVIEQLGFKEEFVRESVPIRQLRYFNQMDGELNMDQCHGIADMIFCETRYGSAIRVIPRPTFYSILYSRIPSHKLLFGKRVIRTQEHDPDGDGGVNGYVSCFCDDGTEYRGSILIGADGAYSTIRQQMYHVLEKTGEMDKDETAPLMPHQHCIAGMTESLDPKEFEILQREYGEFQVMRGKEQKHSVWLMPLTKYRIAWTLFCHFPEDLHQEYKDIQLALRQISTSLSASSNDNNNSNNNSNDNGDFTSANASHHERLRYCLTKKVQEHAQAILESLRGMRNPLSSASGVFGDLLDRTNPDLISKVTIEQGVYSRWYHNRTVLIGDACHKSLPYGGQGANQAILDSIFLVTQLQKLVCSSYGDHVTEVTGPRSSLQPPTRSEITAIFEEYYRERSVIAKVATMGSSWFDHIFGGQGTEIFGIL